MISQPWPCKCSKLDNTDLADVGNRAGPEFPKRTEVNDYILNSLRRKKDGESVGSLVSYLET